MFLKRLTITGFKSFATKTVLELEPGLIAVVGPNGSGKSNIADAVRWVLGEQSTRSLRTKKSEEVVFAGSDKRAKASMAEVSLLLDNSDGASKLDFSEIELSRRLYRSGESEYRLNGRKVTLRDISQLLIQAGFGPNSYSVIGQGMIDQLILASPAERKLLFDEASGIRGFEIKREQALRKLEATEGNLVRVRDILLELAPQLTTLKRGAEAAEARRNLTDELRDRRATYLVTAEHHYTAKRLSAKENLARTLKELKEVEEHISKLQQQRAAIAVPPAPDFSNLHRMETERDQLTSQLSTKRAEQQTLADKQMELAAQQQIIVELGRDITRAQRRRQDLTHLLAEARVVEAETAEQLTKIGKSITAYQAKLAKLRRESDQTSRQEYITHALSILKHVSYGLSEGGMSNEDIRLLVYKAGRLLSHASTGQGDMAQSIREAQADLMSAMKQREDAHEPYTNAVIKVRSLELDLTHTQDHLSELTEKLGAAKQRKTEQEAVGPRFAQSEAEINQLETRLADLISQITQLRQVADDQVAATRDTDEIFRLASVLEESKSKNESLQNARRAMDSQLSEAAEQLESLGVQRQAWFGSAQIEAKVAGQSLEELSRQLAVLEARLADTQSADAQALEEYQEVRERYEFLSSQVSDLTTAQADLQKVVEELDKLIKTQFEVAFAAMGEHFAHYFSKLFDGGKASLSLRPDATGTYGIEIKAIPPGKRIESLATLSGGERALTGTALLAAILRINPSPFVVLDEIDAALDEANSARLSQILLELTDHSQLVAITHNRQIMTVAKALYGVTMDQNHSSKVLSVRLETASQMAARQ